MAPLPQPGAGLDRTALESAPLGAGLAAGGGAGRAAGAGPSLSLFPGGRQMRVVRLLRLRAALTLLGEVPRRLASRGVPGSRRTQKGSGTR